jgi:TonB family protein
VFDPVESLLIGAGRSAGLRLADPSVAQLHCLLKFELGELSLLDLGSVRPTLINGAPVQGQRPLSLGERISIGAQTIEIVAIEETRFTAPRTSKTKKSNPVVEARLFWKDTLLAVAQCGSGALCFGPDSPLSSPIARLKKDGTATISVPPGAQIIGGAARAATATSVSDESTLRRGESTRIAWGDFELDVRVAEAPPRLTPEPFELDPLLPLVLIGLVALAVFAWRVTEASFDEVAWADDFFGDAKQIERWVIAVQPPTPKPIEKVAEETAQTSSDDLDDRRARGPRDAAPGKPGQPGEKAPKSREQILRAGLLGVMGSGGGAGLAGVLGGAGNFGAGLDAALGNLKGGNMALADSDGLGGLGQRGMPGGGSGGLGIGGLGTGLGGGGGGAGGGSGGGGGGGGLGQKKAMRRQVVPGKSVLAGSCEREVIGAVIGKNARQVLACYEAELTRAPHLAGKLAVRFTIEPTGRVSDLEIAESTLGNPSVERCVVSRIQRWRFPEPKGGGLCVVNYPWVFQQAGEGG